MKIDIKNALTIILGLLALIGSIYRLAQVEAHINSRISLLEYNLISKLDLIERRIEVNLTQYQADKENIYEYRLNNTDKLIEHKFNRLASWITQITGYLHKEAGFQIRDDKF
ncbi:hypothetical protein CDG76_20830 [Nostoc sp. 'Peltigera membranacea cyanobiont' 210A]|uniref:hypothetical protein n=1 Tax=Nostoc sp. 'Peltigera membranacea cyanobiont' 210A TaxID=2014529 RepID=UPI000B952224|nr:hypothetical protein [Nostoc sp. 'Peltigera membranacea cyanobiont' 210A]OYD93140.1 hypothetical protein CDG76_20830 [Nostoc sp. 'Peltigera membranacea cyanobiont' 210A]